MPKIEFDTTEVRVTLSKALIYVSPRKEHGYVLDATNDFERDVSEIGNDISDLDIRNLPNEPGLYLYTGTLSGQAYGFDDFETYWTGKAEKITVVEVEAFQAEIRAADKEIEDA